MKKLKYLIFSVIITLLVVVLVMMLKEYTIIALQSKEVRVNRISNELYQTGTRRFSLIKEIIREENCINNYSDSLIGLIKGRSQFKKSDFIEYINEEYKINRLSILYFDLCFNNDELNEKQIILNQNTIVINNLIDSYNNSVMEYNKYFSTFPNFIFLKNNGFDKKEFFDIKYGVNNENPIKKKTQMPKWAVDVDTL